MNLSDVITAAGSRISNASEYLWQCFGNNAYSIDFRDTDGEECTSCTYDKEHQFVFEITVSVPGQDQCFRWINPEYREAYVNECKQRNINPSIAWDDLRYTEISDESLMLEYVKDVGETYYDDLPISEESDIDEKGRVSVPLEMTEEETFRLMTLAHEADLTLNEYVEKILEKEILRIEGSNLQLSTIKENKMTDKKRHMVKLDVRFELEVFADSANDALEKARHFQKTMTHSWGEGDDVSWMDTLIVKEIVETETSI